MKLKTSLSSIFCKMMFAFLLVTAPLYYLSLRIYEWGEKSVREQIFSSLQSQVHFYLTTLEKEIDRMIRFQREYVNNDDLMKLAVAANTMSDYEKSQSMKRIWYQLNVLQRSSIYIAKASAYIPALERRISNEEHSEPIPPEEFNQLHLHAYAPESPLLYWQGRLYLSESYPNPPLPLKRTPMFILGLQLSIEELERFLQQFASGSKGTAALVHRDWVVGGDGKPHMREMIQTAYADLIRSGALQETGTVTVGDKRYFSVAERSSSLGVALALFVPEEQVLGPLASFRQYYHMLILLAAIVVVLFSYWIYRLIHRPLTLLVRMFRKLEMGNLHVSLNQRSHDEFGYLYEQFNLMVQRLRTLFQEVYEQKIRAQRSELKQLQSQINPHFLYNSFYILHRMTKMGDMANVQSFTKYLGDYFQFITRSDSDEVTLRQEMAHARSYIEIQNFRFGSRIAATVDELPEAHAELAVPRLILLPLIENAYNYALEHKMSEGLLRVKVYRENERLLLSVEDNGPGMSDDELSRWNRLLQGNDDFEEMTAISNINRRLKIKFGTDAGVEVGRSELGGFCVTLKIPLVSG